MSMKYALVSADDKTKALATATSNGGLLGIQFSPNVFAASVPTSVDESTLFTATKLTTDQGEEIDVRTEWLEDVSDIFKAAWEKLDGTPVSKVERPLPLSKTGHIALAILVINGVEDAHALTDDELGTLVVPGIMRGAMSLAYSFPKANLTFEFDPYHITINPANQVPYVGATKWPSPVVYRNKLYCFFQGNKFNSKKLMFDVYDPSIGAWQGVQNLPATTITDGPSAVVFNDKLYVFHSGNASRHEIWYKVFDGTSWTDDTRIYNTRITGGPSAVVHNGKIYCFHQGYTNNDNELWYNVYDGNTWVGDKLVTDTLISESPSAIVFKDKIYCFYQGVGDLKNSILVNRMDPATLEWSGHVTIPYTGSLTNGPSAVVFDSKIYVFHQSGDLGELWFNTSNDGILWRGDTPITHMTSTDGLGTTVFQDQLYMFYQGTGKSIQSLLYRSFTAGSLEWEDVWADPALQQLGYSTGYKGFEELAEATRVKAGADYGYVACVTKLPLLYNSYADGTRLCMQYPDNEDISNTFAQVFDSSGLFDSASDPSSTPRYTFAHRSAMDNTIAISLYSTGFLFRQGAGQNSGMRLWYSLLDRRTGRWAEMQGPVTSTTKGGTSSGVFLSNSKLYVFYQVVENNEGVLYYNILDGVTWQGEKKVPISKAAGSPGCIFYKGGIHVFYQGFNTEGQFWYNVLNTTTDAWQGPIQLQLQDDEFDADGNLIFHTQMTLGPSCVEYLNNNVYNLYNGAVQTPQDNGQMLDGRLRESVFNGKGAITDMQVVNTYLTGEPATVVYEDKIYCFHQGSRSDGTLWYNISNGTDWEGDKRFPLANSLQVSDGPAAMALEGKLYCFVKGKGKLSDKIWYNILEGAKWQQQQVLPTGSGVSGQHDALAIGSLAIQWDTTPPTWDRVI